MIYMSILNNHVHPAQLRFSLLSSQSMIACDARCYQKFAA